MAGCRDIPVQPAFSLIFIIHLTVPSQVRHSPAILLPPQNSFDDAFASLRSGSGLCPGKHIAMNSWTEKQDNLPLENVGFIVIRPGCHWQVVVPKAPVPAG